MTRINLVPPTELCDKHLLAEYRELPRVFRLARSCPDAPAHYVLGRGHVKFFYDRLSFLYNRFKLLVNECQARGFNIQYTEPKIDLGQLNDNTLWQDYIPTPEALALNRQRIADRIATMKKPPVYTRRGAPSTV